MNRPDEPLDPDQIENAAPSDPIRGDENADLRRSKRSLISWATYLVVIPSLLLVLMPTLPDLLDKSLGRFLPDHVAEAPPLKIGLVSISTPTNNHAASQKHRNTIHHAADFFDNLSGETFFRVAGRQIELVPLAEKQFNGHSCVQDFGNKLNDLTAILGPISTDCSRALINAELGIPFITSFATNPHLARTERSPFYRTVPNDGQRADALVRAWRETPAGALDPNDRLLIIYSSDNGYSLGNLDIILMLFLDENVAIDLYDADHDTYVRATCPGAELADTGGCPPILVRERPAYKVIFITNQPSQLKAPIELFKTTQDTATSDGWHARFIVFSEDAPEIFYDSPGSYIGMTPTLASYNLNDTNHLLGVPAARLSDYSAASFMAFEALHRAISGALTAPSDTCRGAATELGQMRCAIDHHLSEGFHSTLAGGKVRFSEQGQIDTAKLAVSEINIIEAVPQLASRSLEGVNLIDIKAKSADIDWLGTPADLHLEALVPVEVTVRADYRPPDWVPSALHTAMNSALSKKFSTRLVADQPLTTSFFPAFIGHYDVMVDNTSNQLRQAPGKVVIEVQSPSHLWWSIIIAVMLAGVQYRRHARLAPHMNVMLRHMAQAAAAALVLYFFTVTLKNRELFFLPQLAFNKDPAINSIFCGVIAGFWRLQIIAYVYDRLQARFHMHPPSDAGAQPPQPRGPGDLQGGVHASPPPSPPQHPPSPPAHRPSPSPLPRGAP